MLAVLLAFYVLFKSITWAKARAKGTPFGWRGAAYLLLWPGMGFRAFLDTDKQPPHPRVGEWVSAVVKTGVGILLIWGLSPTLSPPALRGWVGMVGICLLLSDGLVHLLSLAWRSSGVVAPPLWNAPLMANSLGSFWSHRWNLAFHDFVAEFLFRTQARALGTGIATLSTFLISGIIHDLVISVPAGGGYGLPTAYFVLQGLGVLVERSRLGRSLGLRRGLPGWLFAMFVVAGPVYWLFHPAFVHEVVLPFLDFVDAVSSGS